MTKILALGASNSQASINKKFATYVAKQMTDAQITLIDLNDFEMPLYGIDKENADGIPAKAEAFSGLIGEHDAIIISLAEHNSNYTVAFKNLTDWVSRLPGKVWQNKQTFLLSTSPGGRGGASVMNIALTTMPYSAADIVANFSLPSFGKNFSETEGILDRELKEKFESELEKFQAALR